MSIACVYGIWRGKPARGAAEREQAALGFPHAERRALARDADVGALEHLGATRDRIALDRGDQRLRQPVVAQQRLPVRVVAARHDLLHLRVGRLLAHGDEVGAGREVAARTGEDRAADLGMLVDVLVAEHEARRHVGGERVALLGAVHRQRQDVAVELGDAVVGADVEDGSHARSVGDGPVRARSEVVLPHRLPRFAPFRLLSWHRDVDVNRRRVPSD